jgi:4-hydroxymandelate oxidase
MELEHFLNLNEFEPEARALMEPGAFHYVAGGAADEVTVRVNRAAFERFSFRPRVFVDVSTVDPSTSFLGKAVSMPVGLAPAALQKVAHPEGEVAAASAAAGAGVPYVLSTLASCSIEEVAAAADEALARRGEAAGRAGEGGDFEGHEDPLEQEPWTIPDPRADSSDFAWGSHPQWFQLYVHKDHGVAVDMVKRAEAAGYAAVCVTADLPVPGYRERELRSRFEPPPYAQPANFGAYARGREMSDMVTGLHDQSLTWDDLSWIRDASHLPLVVKGILSPEDASLAVEYGAAGIVVSNHGGRQLDQSPASIDALEEAVDAVGGRAEVYLDSGVRRGTDVIIAIAIGASGVFIGRPFLYGLAVGGRAGVMRVLELLRIEIEVGMQLLGVTRIDQIDRSCLRS